VPDFDAFIAACATYNLLVGVNADTGERRSVRYAAGAAAESLERFIEGHDLAEAAVFTDEADYQRDLATGHFFEEDDAPTVSDLRRLFPHAIEPVPLDELEAREAEGLTPQQKIRAREALHGDPALAQEEVEQELLGLPGTLTELEAWEAEHRRDLLAALRRLLDLRVEACDLERWVRAQDFDAAVLTAAIEHVDFEWLFAHALTPASH
jgi:hypothetical protein